MSAARRARENERIRPVLSIAAAAITLTIAVFGVLSAMPIYDTASLWLSGGISAALAFVLVWLGTRLRLGALTLVALALGFALMLVPLGVPSALTQGPAGLLNGLGDGLAAVALGWKQLLTLSLPVGTYQTVLVPFITVIYVSVAAAASLTLRGGRSVPVASLFIVAPVVFGTVFGSSAISEPFALGWITARAPRELGIWLGAFGFAVAWVAWSSGRERRAALKRGRLADASLSTGAVRLPGAPTARSGRSAVRRNTLIRGGIATVTVIAALALAFVVAPVATGETRTVPRDRIDPELVVREGVSPLSSYRSWKRDATLMEPLFTVSSEDDALPSRLRIAVLAGFDGVDFTVGDPQQVGRFTRFPSGGQIDDPQQVTVQIEAGYSKAWVPIAAPLAAPPVFTGSRAAGLSDSFYLNRDAGSAVAVPTAAGLREGDGYRATMSAAPDASLGGGPVSESPLFDLETMPQLARWLELQELPATDDGLLEAIERLRERGYLSHSLTEGEGEGLWLRELGDDQVRFVSSPGGHSEARLEDLFAQLIEQQIAAGEGADRSMLVAGIGDDEQFAAASALLARAMGYDSRVVVGVRLGNEAAGVPGVPACSEVCAGINVAAWIEVRGADGVWAPVDVSPQTDIAPTMLQKGEQLPEFPTQPEEQDATEADQPVGMSNQEAGDPGNDDEDRLSALWPTLRIAGLLLLAVMLIALLALFIPVVKRLRTQRRRSHPSPEVRALGAWDELLDTYRDSGAVVPRGGGRDAKMRALGIAGGDWIAWTTDQAVYSREGITVETATALWGVVDAKIAERRKTQSFWSRFVSRFSLASFGGIFSRTKLGTFRGRAKGAVR